MATTTLAPDYQRILSVLESEAGREGMRCQQLAVALGLEAVLRNVDVAISGDLTFRHHRMGDRDV
ncbi:hypothetical protein [Streptomyces sp. NPDC050534]|uniref:hypothetical protein n=1 Tax=Streptomyces sp. NPDC050534 TaxID=3365625 RepID=UPI0037BDDC54